MLDHLQHLNLASQLGYLIGSGQHAAAQKLLIEAGRQSESQRFLPPGARPIPTPASPLPSPRIISAEEQAFADAMDRAFSMLTTEVTNTASDIQSEILAVVADETPTEMFFVLWDKIKAHRERLKELERMLDAKAVERIQTTGHDMQCGTIRKYLGVKKTTKCVDPIAALDALLFHFHGDLAAVVEHLAGEPFKHGACRKTLPAEIYDRLFVMEEKVDLKEGVAKKELLTVDTRYLTNHSGSGASVDENGCA